MLRRLLEVGGSAIDIGYADYSVLACISTKCTDATPFRIVAAHLMRTLGAVPDACGHLPLDLLEALTTRVTSLRYCGGTFTPDCLIGGALLPRGIDNSRGATLLLDPEIKRPTDATRLFSYCMYLPAVSRSQTNDLLQELLAEGGIRILSFKRNIGRDVEEQLVTAIQRRLQAESEAAELAGALPRQAFWCLPRGPTSLIIGYLSHVSGSKVDLFSKEYERLLGERAERVLQERASLSLAATAAAMEVAAGDADDDADGDVHM